MIPFYLNGLLSSELYKILSISGKENFLKLYDSSYNDKFNILFTGLQSDAVVYWSNELPPKIVARSVNTNEPIILFDGMVHGYDASIAGFFMGQERLDHNYKIYMDKSSNSAFELYLNFEYDGEGEDEPQDELFDDLFQAQQSWYFRNGIKNVREMTSCAFLTITIILKTPDGKYIKILEEETA